MVDITDEWDFKEQLMLCYGSQIGGREWQKTKGLNEYRGASIGIAYAEGFKTNRFLPLRLDALLKIANKAKSEKEEVYETKN